MTHRPRELAGFVAESTAHAALTGAWTAAGELPAAKRRLARSAVIATVALVAVTTGDRPEARDVPPAPAEGPGDAATGAPTGPPPGRLVTTAALGLSAAVYLGSRRLEKRWLAGLVRSGHPHPHRALGVRLAALSLMTSLAARLLSTKAASWTVAPTPERAADPTLS